WFDVVPVIFDLSGTCLGVRAVLERPHHSLHLLFDLFASSGSPWGVDAEVAFDPVPELLGFGFTIAAKKSLDSLLKISCQIGHDDAVPLLCEVPVASFAYLTGQTDKALSEGLSSLQRGTFGHLDA